MACATCEFRGFVETEVQWGGRTRPIVKPCHVCDDTEAYSERVQMALIAERATNLLAKAKRRRLRLLQGGLKDGVERSEAPVERPTLYLIQGGMNGKT